MEILFEDQNIIVCIKEVGIDSEHQLPTLLKEHCACDIYTVHRLDLNVGGIMVYAKNKHTASLLSKTIQEGQMIKEYVCLVHGRLDVSKDILEDFLYKDKRKNKVFVVKKERRGVKKAKLAYDVLKESDDTSLVHVRLYTGRSHQIRVQFATRKHPLVGDHKYGSQAKVTVPYLYSCKITFPYKKETLSFEKYPDWAK